jgi:hypothetical protein
MRVQFEIMNLEVEKLFAINLQETDSIKLNERCDLIREFIEACGWDIESYGRRIMGFDKKLESQ